MTEPLEREFLREVRAGLASLPFDLKVLFEAKDDPDLDRKAREVACGAILYVLMGADVIGEKSIIGYVDDVILLRMALKSIFETGGEAVGAFRQRFAEQCEPVDQQLSCFREFMGADLFDWLAAKATGLPKLVYRSKKVGTYIDDEEMAEDLYERGLTFQTDYDLTEQILTDKFKQVRPVLEHLQRRKTEESKRIS